MVCDETLSILSEHLADCPTTVVISTHRVYEVEPLVDHVGVLSEGRLLGQLPRDELYGGLLRYWADVPEGWSPPGELAGRVVRRSGAARAIEWTVWGDRNAVTRGLSQAGAAVREVAPLSVDEAALAGGVRPSAESLTRRHTLGPHRCTRPLPPPPISASTSVTPTRWKSPGIECFRQPAAVPNSNARLSSAWVARA